MDKFVLSSPEELTRAVEALGFLPFFKNRISGFSVDEMCPPELWFAQDTDGPWEWKGPVASSGKCIYGKVFAGKAGFVSREWLPRFANLRRDGYDLDSRYEEGILDRREKLIFDGVEKYGVILSKNLRNETGFGRGGSKGFDGLITRLQMQTYVCVADFKYARDKSGKEYGWGIAEYTTPEHLFGYDYVTSAYSEDPRQSREAIKAHLLGILPGLSDRDLSYILG